MDDVRFLENKFSEQIRFHLNKCLPKLSNEFCAYRPATNFEDSNLSYDLVFNLDFTISIRIRKYKYLKYNDMTIRSKSKKGYTTEVDKINKGLGQIYFYSYMNELENELIKIRIVNVNAIRHLTESNNYIKKSNTDGTEFFAYNFTDIKNVNGNIYQFDKT